MKARVVHAVFAAGVRSPHLIDKWEVDPESLRVHGLDPQSVDLPALRQFAGLTAKVRHNGARNLLPMSFRFLAAAGMELELFADYASDCSRDGQKFDGPPAERCSKLLDYMEQWLDMDQRDHVLLWDLIRHEYAAVSLNSLPEASGDASPGANRGAGAPPIEAGTQSLAPALFASSSRARTGPARPSELSGTPSPYAAPSSVVRASSLEVTRAVPDCVPRIRGRMLLHEMQSDPRLLAAVMSQRIPQWNAIAISQHYFGYWRPAAGGETHMLELDEFSFFALSFMDGKRTAAELNELMGGADQPSREFLQALDQLAEAGIARFSK